MTASQPHLLPGEVVHLSLLYTRIVEVHPGRIVVDSGGQRVEIPYHADVTFQRQRPAAGMPQEGDIWRDRDGCRWVAVEVTGGGRTAGMYLMRSRGDGELHHWTRINEQCGPLVLEYRPDGGAE